MYTATLACEDGISALELGRLAMGHRGQEGDGFLLSFGP